MASRCAMLRRTGIVIHDPLDRRAKPIVPAANGDVGGGGTERGANRLRARQTGGQDGADPGGDQREPGRGQEHEMPGRMTYPIRHMARPDLHDEVSQTGSLRNPVAAMDVLMPDEMAFHGPLFNARRTSMRAAALARGFHTALAQTIEDNFRMNKNCIACSPRINTSGALHMRDRQENNLRY